MFGLHHFIIFCGLPVVTEQRCTAVNFFMTTATDTNYILKYQESAWSVDPDARTSISPDGGISSFQINNFSCGGWLFYPYGGDILTSDISVWYYSYIQQPSFIPIIYKSTNYGVEWMEISVVPGLRNTGPENQFGQEHGGGFIKINPFNSNYIFAVHKDHMMLSTDGGYHFNPLNIPPLKELAFDFTDSIMYGVSLNKIYKSPDNGISWDSSIVSFDLNTLEVSPDNNHIIYGGTASGLYRSSNQGLSWYLYNNSFAASKNIIGLSKEKNTGDTIIACTNDAVYKVYRDQLVEISGTLNHLPKTFSLDQNFPNPFNPKTKIFYSIPISQYISLKVYDVRGNEIVSLVNQKQNAGNYSVEFDGTNYSSGVYFYKIDTGDFLGIRKMILIK